MLQIQIAVLYYSVLHLYYVYCIRVRKTLQAQKLYIWLYILYLFMLTLHLQSSLAILSDYLNLWAVFIIIQILKPRYLCIVWRNLTCWTSVKAKSYSKVEFLALLLWIPSFFFKYPCCASKKRICSPVSVLFWKFGVFLPEFAFLHPVNTNNVNWMNNKQCFSCWLFMQLSIQTYAH